MKKPLAVAILAAAVTGGLAISVAHAQSKEVTVSYLQAAVSSLPEQAEVTLTAVFPGVSNLRDCHGHYLRNDGYSRFSVKDPQSKTTFDSMYVLQTSKVFPVLLNASGARRIRFHGYREYGEDRDDAIFVTSAEDLGPAAPAAAATPGTAVVSAVTGVEVLGGPGPAPRTYRVTLVDGATSNRTVIINIQTNRPYTVNGTTVLVEQEP